MNIASRRVAILGLLFFSFFALGAGLDSSWHNSEPVICSEGKKFFIEEFIPVGSVIPDAKNNDLIIVDIVTKSLTLYRDQKEFKKYPVATGAAETPSPVGEWRIVHKGGNWGGGFGERWLGINVPWGIYGIHGTDQPGSIGYNASHGCIRMFNKDVIELYDTVKVGTPVIIKGKLPQISPRREYKTGSSGEDVMVMQVRLREAGFDPGDTDGVFGQGTTKAVQRLQKFYGLEPTGNVGLNEQYIIGLR